MDGGDTKGPLDISALIKAKGAHCVRAQEMPRRATRMVEGMRAWVRAVEKRRVEARRWERVQARGRVREGVVWGWGGEVGRKGLVSCWALVKSGEEASSSGCGVSGVAVGVEGRGCGEEMKRGRRRFVRSAVVAKRIMEKVP